MPEPFFIDRDMNNSIRADYKFILIVSFLMPLDAVAYESEASWKNAIPTAALFGGIVGSLAITKKIAERQSVTAAINNRIAYPLYQRLYDDQEAEMNEDELREHNREQIEKSLTSLISRTQKRFAIIGVALTIAAASDSQWWTTFANNIGWIQARTEFGMSMLYYCIEQEGVIHPLFSSPIRESMWIASALIYTQFAGMHRNKELAEIYDFPELAFMWLSYLYEIGRIDP